MILKYTLRTAITFLLSLIFIMDPVQCYPAEREKRPLWWLENGICLAGNWEPMAFRVRRGPIPVNYRERYEFEHSSEAVLGLKNAGVTMVLTHFYKSLGSEVDERELAYTKKLADICHENGMFVGTYVGATLFNETTYQEIPEAREWIQYNNSGEAILYGSIKNFAKQYFRHRVDITHKGYREHIKSWVTRAIKEFDSDLVHFDNFGSFFPPEAGYTDHIQKLFREYLERKYTAEERIERLGFSDLSWISPPRVVREPMRPVIDPLIQEWICFRVDAVTDYSRELSMHVRTLDPEVVVEFNPGGLGGVNTAYKAGIDHARLFPLSDANWSEYADHASYFPEENRLVCKIRSYKLGRHFGNAIFTYINNPLELAEALAFNRMCLGDVGFRVIENWPQGVDMDDAYRYRKREYYVEGEKLTDSGKTEIKKYIKFFHQNKKFYQNLELVADVGVMRDFSSLSYGGWIPHLCTVQAEQVLIQNRIPFDILFEQDWENLDKYRVIVLAAQENLSDREIFLLKEYIEEGGSAVVVGSTGVYDSCRRERCGKDVFWNLLGVKVSVEDLKESARIKLGGGRIFYMPRFENHPKVPDIDNQVYPDYWYLPLNWREFMEGLYYCSRGDFSIIVETKPYVAAAHYRKGKMRQVHLVNYWPDHPVRHIPVIFSQKGIKPKKAFLYSPDHDPLDLDLGPYHGGWAVIVPEINIYGMVVFD